MKTNDQDHSQCIHCDVGSCEHNDQSGKCALNAIKVSPCPNCNSGDKQDESMCASYDEMK